MTRNLKAENGEQLLFPEPPQLYSHLRWRNALLLIGPGAIVASVTIGSGELVLASRSGAIFGYSMLWCFLYAGIFKAVQVYTGARYLTLTGEHPLKAWRQIPGPRHWLLWLIILPTIPIMPIMISAIAEIVGTFSTFLVGWEVSSDPVWFWDRLELSHNFWASVVLALCFGLARRSSYSLLENISVLILALLTLCVAASAISSGPRLLEILTGLVVPRVPEFEGWLVSDPRYSESFIGRSPWIEVSLYLWAVGGGTQDYIGYVGMVREKKWGLAGMQDTSVGKLAQAMAGSHAQEEQRRARIWLRAPLADTAISFSLVVIVTLLFVILGAQILYPTHTVPDGNDLVTVQEAFLTYLHPWLSLLYRVSVFLALGGTLYGIFEVYGVSLCESARALFQSDEHQPFHRYNGLFQYLIFAVSMILIWLPAKLAGDIVGRIGFATVIGGATSTALWLLAMLWVDRHLVPASVRMHAGLKGLAWVAAAVMMVLGIQSILAFFS